ncbi:ABC transporter ATP-binding protein, partial [Candidatus Woesearchaeota archaeon]|nr:ABC transporter ATP-binding protein [Candidatus Woesearchaeota archaeon]
MYRDVWKQVFKLTKKSHFQIILSVVLLTATLILIQLKPIVIQKLIDGAVAGENISSYVIQMGILLFVVTVFFRLFDIVAVKVMTRTYESSQNHAMEHIMKHSHAFFTDNFSGSLVAKSKRFANSVNAVYELFVFNIYNAILMIIITTIILFFKNKFIALIFLGWAIIYS